ncbi:MAG: T9SS type A sorting domain-containing protein, partial [Lentimicrobiaceae bacterium]|nr:T9SS type A sorting domain-containing protein [Lentimicrobiaceae bacterium]
QLKFVTWNQDDSLTYTVNFTVALSTEALLSDLMVDGLTIEDFDANTLNYFIMYEYGTETLPEVAAVATQPDARVDISTITEYPSVVYITVYAGDTTISRTYSISFSTEAGDNNYLSDLLLDGVSLPEFSRNIFFYEVELPYGTVQFPEIDAVVEDERADTVITQASQLVNTAKIEVIALNGDSRVYEVSFIIRKNDNTYITNIFIDWDTLKDFDPTERNYTYVLPNDYKGIPFVAAELEDPNATYVIVNPTTVPAQMRIVVTAEDGETQSTYRITFDKATHTASYGGGQTEINVYPNPSSDKIYIDVNGLPQAGSLEIYTIEGRLVGSRLLQEGTNIIPIDNLSNGMYFYKISADKTTIGRGKFVKN